MTPDQYNELSAKERLMYDELAAFSKRLALRMVEIVDLLKKILGEAAP